MPQWLELFVASCVCFGEKFMKLLCKLNKFTIRTELLHINFSFAEAKKHTTDIHKNSHKSDRMMLFLFFLMFFLSITWAWCDIIEWNILCVSRLTFWTLSGWVTFGPLMRNGFVKEKKRTFCPIEIYVNGPLDGWTHMCWWWWWRVWSWISSSWLFVYRKAFSIKSNDEHKIAKPEVNSSHSWYLWRHSVSHTFLVFCFFVCQFESINNKITFCIRNSMLVNGITVNTN